RFYCKCFVAHDPVLFHGVGVPVVGIGTVFQTADDREADRRRFAPIGGISLPDEFLVSFFVKQRRQLGAVQVYLGGEVLVGYGDYIHIFIHGLPIAFTGTLHINARVRALK